MFESLLKMASEQSFSVALLLTIAYVLWRTMRADLLKSVAKYDALEARFNGLQVEFRECIRAHQDETHILLMDQQTKYETMMRQQTDLMRHTTDVLEQNTQVLKRLSNIS